MLSRSNPSGDGRRSGVLDAALATFARYGYRKTSMDDIADRARISRQGLYFLFSSKAALFAAAAERAIELDLASAGAALEARDQSLEERIVTAFDHWAGRYVDELPDMPALLGANPTLLGPVAARAPSHFERLLIDALRVEIGDRDAKAVARVLITASIGALQQVTTRVDYVARMREATGLILGGAR